MTTAHERTRALAQANTRARARTTRQLAKLLDQLAAEAAALATRVRRLADDPDQADALDILAGLADAPRKPRETATVDRLTRAARTTAVDLALAHEATWRQIGDALGMAHANAHKKYTTEQGKD